MRAALAAALVLCAAVGPHGAAVEDHQGDQAAEEAGADEELPDLPDLGIDWSELSPEAAKRIKTQIAKKSKDAAQASKERRQKREEEVVRRQQQDFNKIARCDFSTPGCWEEFYQMHTGHFDWYQVPVSVLEPHLDSVPGDLRVLHVGCGTSTWTKEIGTLPRVSSVLNTDINGPAVERMRELYGNDTRLQFEVMDAANMTLASESFDVVLDKGLLDIFRPRGDEAVLGTAREMRRVLRRGGLLAFVSYSGPEKTPAQLVQWCTHHDVKDANLYVCLKGDAEEAALWGPASRGPDAAREEL